MSVWQPAWKKCNTSHLLVSQPDPQQQAASAGLRRNAVLPCLRNKDQAVKMSKVVAGYAKLDDCRTGRTGERQFVRPVLCDGAVQPKSDGWGRRIVSLKMHRRQVAYDHPSLGVTRIAAGREAHQIESDHWRDAKGQNEVSDGRRPAVTSHEAPGLVRGQATVNCT